MIHTTATELSDAELLRYSRQILLAGWDIDAQLKLKNSHVVIIGAGGLGCPASETLARAGVGRIELIDDDVIEESNLQRQTLFLPTDVGQYKAQAAANALQAINAFIQVDYRTQRLTEALAQTWFDTDNLPNLLLDCSDNFATRDLVNRISVRHGVPLLSASAIAMTGQLALFEPSKETGCYHCIFPNVGEQADERNCATSGVLASTTAVMGNLQANAALQFLGLGHNPLAGKLLLWDGQRMTQRTIGYPKDTECVVCGTNLSRGERPSS